MSPLNQVQHNRNTTQRKFSQAAVNYQLHACVQNISANKLLKSINENNKGLCLDLGAGPGVNTHALSKKYEKVVSLDLSFSMLEQVKNNNEENALKVCADMDFLPFQHNSFDAIFSNFATQWSQNLPQLFKNLYCSLKPQGKIYLTIVCDGTLVEIAQAWQGVDNENHINQFVKPNVLLNYIQAANLDIKSFEINCHQDTFDDPLNAIKSIKQIGASNIIQTKVNKGLMGKNRLKALLKAYPKTHSGFNVSYQVAYLTLEKNI